MGERKRTYWTTAKKRAYQKDYYQKHKEAAKEYQRQYRLSHKKSTTTKSRCASKVKFKREPFQRTYNAKDIMRSHDDNLIKRLEHILAGRRLLTL